MYTFILFWFSFIAIVLMLGYKIFEAKVRKIHFVSNAVARLDKNTHATLEKIRLTYRRSEKIASIFVFEFIPGLLYEYLTRAKDYVAKKYYEADSSFRGKRMLKSNGSVSFFLEKLSEKEPSLNREV